MVEAVDNFAHELGWFIIFAAFLATYIWLAIMSPLLGWLTLQTLMALWALATIGATLFVVWRQLGESEYFGAIGALLAGGFLSFPWVLVAREFYPANFPPKPHERKLWI